MGASTLCGVISQLLDLSIPRIWYPIAGSSHSFPSSTSRWNVDPCIRFGLSTNLSSFTPPNQATILFTRLRHLASTVIRVGPVSDQSVPLRLCDLLDVLCSAPPSSNVRNTSLIHSFPSAQHCRVILRDRLR